VLGDLAYQKRLEWVEATVYVVEALEILAWLIESEPKNYEARLYKWVLFYENAQYPEAAEVFENIIADDSKNEDAYYYLGKSLADQWSTEIAIETFLTLLEINPNHPWASEELVELGNQ
jgi:TolA-binding protein